MQNQDAQSAKNLEQRNRATAKNRAAEDYNQAVSDGDSAVAQAKAAWDSAEQALQDFLQTRPDIIGSVNGIENRGAGKPNSEGELEAEKKNQGADESQLEFRGNSKSSGENQTESNGNSQSLGENQPESKGNSQSLGENQPEKDENSQSPEEEQPEAEKDGQDAGENPSGKDRDGKGTEKGQPETEGSGQDTGKGQSETDKNQDTGEENNQNPEANLADWEAQKAQLEQAAAEAKAAYEAAISSRADNVKAAARALEDASAPTAADSTSKQNDITKKQQELALQKLQALKEAEGKILAPVRGVVTQIAITTGDFTTEGTAIRLSDTSQGNRLVASVDKANEEYVSKGSQVVISVSGSKDKISDYTVANVTENEEDKTLLDVMVDLPKGVLEAGLRVEIEIVQKSENYTSVIPIQALHEEQNGYYVLVAQEEQGVMGKELIARRFEVKVQDKNDTYAALEDGLLTGEQEIISSSSRAIGDGSRVRKSEE